MPFCPSCGIQKHYAAILKFGAATKFIRGGQPSKAIGELESAVALNPLELAPGDRLNLSEMALFGIPYSKLTAKSSLWPIYP